MRSAITAALACALALCAGCEREQRVFYTKGPASSAPKPTRQSELQPGPKAPAARRIDEYEENAYALSEGKTLYTAFNCHGCHAHGGGDIGPPLMDDTWRYGGGPAQVYETILAGRPDGMPSFAGKITADQAWKLTAYVRSLSGLVPMDAAPGRLDSMRVKAPENSVREAEPRNAKESTK